MERGIGSDAVAHLTEEVANFCSVNELRAFPAEGCCERNARVEGVGGWGWSKIAVAVPSAIGKERTKSSLANSLTGGRTLLRMLRGCGAFE